jgi:hypothetical protein
MSASKLIDYGLVPVSTFGIEDDDFIIETHNREIVELEKCIYAFALGDLILRIGSSKERLARRFRSWELDVSKALKGLKSHTGLSEAENWRNELKGKEKGVIYARQGTVVTTPIGSFQSYLDEESVLIGRYQPKFNNSKHR